MAGSSSPGRSDRVSDLFLLASTGSSFPLIDDGRRPRRGGGRWPAAAAPSGVGSLVGGVNRRGVKAVLFPHPRPSPHTYARTTTWCGKWGTTSTISPRIPLVDGDFDYSTRVAAHPPSRLIKSVYFFPPSANHICAYNIILVGELYYLVETNKSAWATLPLLALFF